MEYAAVRLTAGNETQYCNSKGSITEKNTPVAAPAIKKLIQTMAPIRWGTVIQRILLIQGIVDQPAS